MRTFTLHSQQLSCFPGSLAVKNPPAMPETWVRSLGREDPLEKEMATHFNILAWEMPWTEEPGGLQSMGSWRVRHGWGNWAWAIDEIAPDGFTEATAVRETWGLGEGKTESLHSKPLKNIFFFNPVNKWPLEKESIQRSLCGFWALPGPLEVFFFILRQSQNLGAQRHPGLHLGVQGGQARVTGMKEKKLQARSLSSPQWTTGLSPPLPGELRN